MSKTLSMQFTLDLWFWRHVAVHLGVHLSCPKYKTSRKGVASPPNHSRCFCLFWRCLCNSLMWVLCNSSTLLQTRQKHLFAMAYIQTRKQHVYIITCLGFVQELYIGLTTKNCNEISKSIWMIWNQLNYLSNRKTYI